MTYNDKPVEGAVVTYIYDDGNTGGGATDASGKFAISFQGKPGAALGNVKVTVAKSASTGSGSAPKDPNKMTPEERKAQMEKMQGMMGAKPGKSVIPEKYSSQSTTDLKTEVKAGDANDYAIVLKD